METFVDAENYALLHGDCRDLDLPENSIDAIVTDPPAGIGFMGKEWDGNKGGRDQWIAWLAEALAPSFRALRPGGHALVWALPKTSHWTAMALELTGFEIRERVSHFFGTGFPKSLNVSKEIDARLGVERPVIGSVERPKFVKGRGHGKDENGRPVYLGVNGGHDGSTTLEVTGAGSAAAAAWEGWGTALKPACEDWWLVRKPFDQTVAANVLEHGTGALNIDGCRIEYTSDADKASATPQGRVTSKPVGHIGAEPAVENHERVGFARSEQKGRWPANVVLDESAAAMLDAQVGVLKSGAVKKGTLRNNTPSVAFGERLGTHEMPEIEANEGGPSRFFYVSKPSGSERDAGLDHLPARTGGEATDRRDGSAALKSPRTGAGRNGGRRNIHPTVKSIDLMRWLCRLITPPGGTILDPFLGSGSTGIAALAEGFSFLGVEQSLEYLEIAKGRIAHGEGR